MSAIGATVAPFPLTPERAQVVAGALAFYRAEICWLWMTERDRQLRGGEIRTANVC